MAWKGNLIYEVAKGKGLSKKALSEQIGVSRPTLDEWINGQVPKGIHLIKLCAILGIKPDQLFDSTIDDEIVVPLHRTKGTAKLNEDMQAQSLELAKEYYFLFKNDIAPNVLPVVRMNVRNKDVAIQLAKYLRDLAGVAKGEPIDYAFTFNLLHKLGINVIIRPFPQKIKSYAFYTKINNHRVVFVNNKVNLLDLIFPLLHEATHAIRDEELNKTFYDEEDEQFCDDVAANIQFPENYAQFVYNSISGLDIRTQINKLIIFAKQYKHSLYGIVKRIQQFHPDFNLDVCKDDTILKKKIICIGEFLSNTGDIYLYLKKLSALSPLFFTKISMQIDNISAREIAELLGLSGSIEGQVIKEQLRKMNENLEM